MGPEKISEESEQEAPDKDSNKNPAEESKTIKSELVEPTVILRRDSKMSFLEPPTFISENKPFEIYQQDLRRWSRLTSLEKKLQAEMVVYKLENHPSNIQEKITTQLGEELVDNEDGIEQLLTFLEGIYKKDSMADAWEKYILFEKNKYDAKVPLKQFIAEWENKYHKLKNVGCEYSDMILAFKLLDASNLSEVDQKFVLTGVDYGKGLRKETLFDQMKESLKKFKGQSVIKGDDEKALASTDTYLAKMEDVFLSKGWKPPPPKKRPNPDGAGGGYKGKKNKLDENQQPMKCFKCKCECVRNCNCPCRYHFADKCTKRDEEQVTLSRGNGTREGKEKKTLTHFIQSNLPEANDNLTLFISTGECSKNDEKVETEMIMVVEVDEINNSEAAAEDMTSSCPPTGGTSENIFSLTGFHARTEKDSREKEEPVQQPPDDEIPADKNKGEVEITEEILCLATALKKEDDVLIDCACPTTVAGEKWIMNFVGNLSPEDK